MVPIEGLTPRFLEAINTPHGPGRSCAVVHLILDRCVDPAGGSEEGTCNRNDDKDSEQDEQSADEHHRHVVFTVEVSDVASGHDERWNLNPRLLEPS